MKLTIRFELHAQQRESFNRRTIWLAIIWIILIDEARARERKHKRRLAAQQELHRREEERRQRRARPASKPPAL